MRLATISPNSAPTIVLAIALAIALGTPLVADAQGQRIQSPSHQVSLVELFTSEGCSSCPPADQWMSKLKNDERLWNTVVPVAFHVDYWDYIGWPDRFASAAYSSRHRDYQRYAGLRSVYTPSFLVKGEEWRGWCRYPILDLQPPPPAGVITLDIATDGAQIEASYAAVPPSPSPSSQALELHLAVLGFDLETAVAGGENGGRILHHDFVVLAHNATAMRAAGSRFTATAILPEPIIASPRRALAAWVSRKGNPAPLQAAGGWLQE